MVVDRSQPVQSHSAADRVDRESLTLAQVLILLADGPARIAALTDGMVPAQLQTSPTTGEWSLNEVLAHLRACADVWGKCITTMLAEDRPTLRAVNPRSWVKQTNYRELEFGASLRAFTVQRAELLVVLQRLPHTAWSRSATVTGAGKVLERTVFFYARWLATHERSHVKAIARIVESMRT